MNTQELAKMIAIKYNMPVAEKYNATFREFDNMIEIIGYINDPNFEARDECDVVPKCWVTIGVIPAETECEL